jgi:hypothetical protein
VPFIWQLLVNFEVTRQVTMGIVLRAKKIISSAAMGKQLRKSRRALLLFLMELSLLAVLI